MRAPTHLRGLRARPATRLPRVLLALALLVAALGAELHDAPSAAASPPVFEMPFTCGQTWHGATYQGHSQYWALDFNTFNGDSWERGQPVLASAAGTVVESRYQESFGYGWGWTVLLDHGGGWTTRYAHLYAQPLVDVGQRVERGHHLGGVGGTPSYFEHLHYVQMLNGVDQPATFGGVPFPYTEFDIPGGYQGLAMTSGNCGPVQVPDPCGSFWDTSASNSFCEAIQWAAANGVTNGYPDGTFRPTEPVSRQALAAFLFRFQRAEPSYPPTYLDVDASHAFADEIGWLQVAGIATGYPDGTFRPTAPITRQAMASFLWKVAGQPTAPPAAFNDVPANHPFAPAIAWLSASGISTGWQDGTFRPGEPLSRQAMVAFLQRFAGG